AKILMEAIQKRFGGNAETKKVQKTLLKQQFENFTGSSSENLDQIHDMLQKLVSQLDIHEKNKADLEEHSLDDLFNSLKIYEAEVKHSSSLGNPTQNLAFVSSSNADRNTDPVSVATSVSAVCAKLHVSSHPNIDSLSNAVIYSFFSSQSTTPQLDNEDLKQIEVDDLKEMDLRWECRSPKDSRRSSATEPQRRTALVKNSTSNALVPSCSKAYAQLHSQYDKLTDDFCKSQFDVLLYQAGLESVKARLVVYKQNESILEENIKLLNIKVQARDTALVTLRQKLEKTKQERDDLKLKFQPSGGYHVVPPPITGIFMPPKPDLVFHTASIAVETYHYAFTVQLSPSKPAQDLSHTNELSAPIIEDWVSDSEDESETNDPQIIPSFVQSFEKVTSPRTSVQPAEAPILDATLKPTSPKSNKS
nr:ribonuclease H-like domain-containing protein [Tanacetum cinerariifolium]